MPSADAIHFSRKLRKVKIVPLQPPVFYSAAELEAAKKESYQRGCGDTSAVMEQHLVEQREELVHLQDKTFAAKE